MIMDKGLSIRQAEDLIESSPDYIDYLKLGFGTSIVTPRLKEKSSYTVTLASTCTLEEHCLKPTTCVGNLTISENG